MCLSNSNASARRHRLSVCVRLCLTHFSDTREAKDMVASSENSESAVFFLAFLHDALHTNPAYLRRVNEKEEGRNKMKEGDGRN